jgi:hypothetical protein
MIENEPRTAFVLTGGGSLGAVQVGMMHALLERGIEPDLFVGASAGALNAAYVAGRAFDAPTLDSLARIWLRLRRHDVFPFDPSRHLLALAGDPAARDSMGRLARARLETGYGDAALAGMLRAAYRSAASWAPRRTRTALHALHLPGAVGA